MPHGASPQSLLHAFPEIFIQLSGKNHFRCGEETFMLNEGEICIMPADVPHQETAKGNSFANIVIVHSTDRFVVPASHAWYERPGAIPIKKCHTGKARQLSDMQTGTAEAFTRNSPAAPHLLQA
ncbi:cupin domain-containing protein [Verrucomicrobia bacterium S94]|nr:cupin domain-containing protein [Verrucomicrobia bacterium S94]